jgi:hypothetical protein
VSAKEVTDRRRRDIHVNCQVGDLRTLTAHPRKEDDTNKLRPARWLKLADDPAGTVAAEASDLVLAGEYAHG